MYILTLMLRATFSNDTLAVIKRLIIGLIFILVAIFVPEFEIPKEILSPLPPSPTITFTPSPTIIETESAKVIRIIDGDTIELDGGIKLRYIGIDTPETLHPTIGVECFGAESSKKNSELVLNKEVRLEKDVSETDRYGRILRYVYIASTSGEIFVNQELVKTGFAEARSYPPDIKYQEILRQAEEEARKNNLGLWGANCNAQ